MTVNEFINNVAEQIVKSCRQNNLLPSPSIAQAIIESTYGNSYLATEANNLFGIKANSDWHGDKIQKETAEWDNTLKQYVLVLTWFRKYPSFVESILDHTNFLLKPSYNNLIGVNDYKEYCNRIHQDGYATSPTYDKTLIDCIEKYNLTKYDIVVDSQSASDEKENNNLIFNIHAGHNPSGMIACGSNCYLNESDENRKVASGLIEKIKNAGHVVYDCTCNDGTSQKDVLQKIVNKCNEHEVDYDISIHFNAVSRENISDGKTKGTEVWIHPNNKGKEIENVAKNICNKISELGFTNRGVKYSDQLYVLRKTKSPAMLIECCFVDDLDDFELYNKDKMVDAIFKGLNLKESNKENKVSLYYVIVGVYNKQENAEALKKSLEQKGYMMDSNGKLNKGIVSQIKRF